MNGFDKYEKSAISALQAGGRWFESNSSHAENEEVTKVTSFFRTIIRS